MLQRPQDKVPDDVLRYLEHFPGDHIFMTLGPIRHYNQAISEVWPALKNLDSFFCINEMPAGKRDKTADIRCRAVWVEDDTDRNDPRDDFPIRPSLITRSSAKHWHYYWLTDTRDKDQWDKVMARMVYSHGCDPGAKDLSRVLRLPGTYNKKAKYSTPFKCKVHDNNGTIYPWSDITKAFPAVSKIPEDPLQHVDKSKSKFNVLSHMNRFMEGRSIWPSMCSLMQHWRFHYSEAKTLDLVNSMFDQLQPKYKEKYADRYKYAKSEVARQLTFATTKVNKYRNRNGILKDNVLFRDVEPLTGTVVRSTSIEAPCLPDILWNAAEACGEYLSMGPDPAILTGMGTISSLLNKNVLIKHIKDSPYENYCTMGMILVMETGTRKTEIYKIMNKPLREYETLLQQTWEKEKNYNKTMADVLAMDLKKLTKEYEKLKEASPKERSAAVMRMAELQDELDALQVHRPTLYTKDITEEEIIRKLHDNGGVLSIVSDDSRNIIKNILGRYNSGSTGEGIYIDGLTGSPEIPVKYHRAKNGGTEYVIQGPALNVFLFVQQDVALTLKQNEMYQVSGLAARLMMYFFPVDPVQLVRDSDRLRKINKEKIQPYYAAVQKLCVQRGKHPLVVTLSDRAQARFNEFNQSYADLLGKDYTMHRLLNKMVTQSVVYAVCMAAIDDPEFQQAIQTGSEYEIKAIHANMGIGVMKTVSEQLIGTYQILDDIEISIVAQKFIRALIQKYKSGSYVDGFVRKSTLYNSFSYLNKDNYIPVIDLLVEKGWLGTVSAEGPVPLNQGITPAARMGDTIYHVNMEGIKKLKQATELRGKNDN